MLKGILPYAHHLLSETVEQGETVIDATCGNGNDTLFLSNLVGEDGQVFGFDIQEQAIKNTKQVLSEHKRSNVNLIQDSHANIEKYVPANINIGGAIFNLGYLPKGDKSVVTKGDSTVIAINKIVDLLKVGGITVIVVYHGHPGGTEEKTSVLEKVKMLDQNYFSVLQYEFINQKNNPPFILAIQKNKR